MPSIVFELGALGVGLIAFAFVGKSFLGGYRSHTRSQRLESTESVRPGEVTPGQETAVVGTIRADRPLDVPIGEGHCVAYYLDMFLGPNDDGFPFEDETAAVRFRLEDQTGSVEVETDDIAIETTTDRTDTFSNSWVFDENPDDLPEDLLAFLESEGIPIPEGWGGVNYEQRYIPEGATGCVYGTVERRDGELVITNGGDEFFVTDSSPEEFLDQRRSIWRRTLKDAGVYLGIGVVSTLGGIILLVA